jgi:hypothetical protein
MVEKVVGSNFTWNTLKEIPSLEIQRPTMFG